MPEPNLRSMRRLRICTVGFAVVALLAGCGSGSSTTTVTHVVTRVVIEPVTSTPTTTTAGAPTTASQTTASQTTASTTTPTGASTTTGAVTTPVRLPACTASDLEPSYLGSNGAPGEIVLSFAVTNHGAVACHTYGFPGVEFLSSSGALLPTRTTRTTQDVLGSTPATEIVLAPGHEASFRMITADVAADGGTDGCVTADSLQVIAPDDTASMRVAITNGTIECGTTSVSPLLPGTDAVPGV